MAEPESQGHLFLKGTEVEVTSDEEGFKGAWYLATVMESFYSPFSTSKKRSTRRGALIQYKTLVTAGGSVPLKEHVDPALVRPLPPNKHPFSAPRVFEVNEIVDAKYRDGWWTGVVRKLLEGSRYRVYFDNPPDIIEFEAKHLRIHWDWVNGNWVRPGKQPMSESVLGSGEDVEVNIEMGNVRDAWFPGVVIKEIGDNAFLVRYHNQKKYDEAGMEKVSVDAVHIRPVPPPFGNRTYELLEKVDAWSELGWRAGVITKVITGGWYNVFFKQGNEDKEFKKSDIRPHAEWVDGKWKPKELDLHEGGRSFHRRKRGRPRKLEVQSVKAFKTGGGEVGSGHSAKILVLKDHPTDGAKLVTWTEAECADESVGKTQGDMRKEDNMSNAGALAKVADDDQPLSTWFYGLSCSTVIEDSRLPSGRSADGGAEGGAEVVSEIECYTIGVNRDHVEDEDQCLPFDKRSPVWKTIESMDVFQIVPQRPHFLPLGKCKEEYREGSAIGIMVTFASLFDKISSLQFDDSRTIFDSTLESLRDLEKHGFDVAILRDRLIKLLLIKEGKGELLNESLNAERLINEQTNERRALSEKMDGITKKMTELKEEYDASKSKLEALDFEITKLKSDADSMKARINNARHDFEVVVATPWRLP